MRAKVSKAQFEILQRFHQKVVLKMNLILSLTKIYNDILKDFETDSFRLSKL